MAAAADGAREELAAYLALAQVPGIGAVRLRDLLGAHQSARAVLAAPAGALAAVPGIGRAAAAAIRAASPATGHRIIDAIERLEPPARVLVPWDPEFPPLLREIPEPPSALFVWGDESLLARPAAALVGSRDHTPYGAEAARLLAAGLARAGVTVVSGMARGLDAVAHHAALDAGGASVGVLGNGLGVVYPAANRGLYDRMVAGGCLVTELPPGERPRVHTFPRRNRLISGLALATVVIEARPDSGAIITADSALEQGRAVLAVPGPITSHTSLGCNRLIQQGAKPCLGAEDILEEIGVPSARNAEHGARSAAPRAPGDLTPIQRTVWDVVAAGPAHVDALSAVAQAAPGDVLAALTALELRGLVVQRAGMRFEVAGD